MDSSDIGDYTLFTNRKTRFGFAAMLLADYLPLPELYRLCRNNTLVACDEIWSRRLQVDYNLDSVTDDPFIEYQNASVYDLYRDIQPIYVSQAMQMFIGLDTNLWTTPDLLQWWTVYIGASDMKRDGYKIDSNVAELLRLPQRSLVSLDDLFKAVHGHISRKRPQLTWEQLIELGASPEVGFTTC